MDTILHALARLITLHDPKFQARVADHILHLSYAFSDHAHIQGTLTDLGNGRANLYWMGQVYPSRIPLQHGPEALRALLEGIEWVHDRHRRIRAPNLAQRRLQYLEALGEAIMSQNPRSNYWANLLGINLCGEVRVNRKYHPWTRFYRWTDRTPGQLWGNGKALGELEPDPPSPSSYTEGWTALPDIIPETATGILRVMESCLQDIHGPPPYRGDRAPLNHGW